MSGSPGCGTLLRIPASTILTRGSVLNCKLSTVDCELLFVYGTLRRGFARHHALRRLGAAFEGKASVQGKLVDLNDNPGMRRAPDSGSRVCGEVYRLRNPQRAFCALDEMEGYRPGRPESSRFVRAPVTARFPDGRECQAWAYWLHRARGGAHRILRGDYARS